MRVGVSLMCLSAFAWLLSCEGRSKPNAPSTEPEGLVTIAMDSLHARPGMIASVNLTAEYAADVDDSIPGLGAFNFHVIYDTDLLSFLEANLGPSLAGWEYFTWRHSVGVIPGRDHSGGVRIIAVRDLANGQASSGSIWPYRNLVRMRFSVSVIRSDTIRCASIAFYSEDPSDNLISGSDGNSSFLPLRHQTGITFGAGFDTVACDGAGTACTEAVDYVGGTVCISEVLPPQLGDLDLDGYPMEESDADLLEQFFLRGLSVWDADPETALRQIGATDINRDGTQLSVSDLEFLERNLNGTLGPGDTITTPLTDTIIVLRSLLADRFGIHIIRRERSVSALWLSISHPDQDSLVPTWVPYDPDARAPMIQYKTENHATRVLVSDWEFMSILPPGYEPIYYSITFPRSPDSRFEIEAAQASSFPGRSVTTQLGTLVNPGPP